MRKRKSKAEIKRRILRFVEEIEWLFDYSNYDRSIVFKVEDQKNKYGRLAAEVIQEADYRRVTIFIYPCFFDSTIKEQREYLLHEFCHVFTNRLYGAAIDLTNGILHTPDQIRGMNEEATSRISLTIDALLRGKKLYARRAYRNFIK